jgi:hypothetical protein
LIEKCALALLICLGCASVALADPAACSDAADGYNSAANDVTDALQSYAGCVDSSEGHDDCSAEFSQLQTAQDDFESAVSDYDTECQ